MYNVSILDTKLWKDTSIEQTEIIGFKESEPHTEP